MVRQLHHITEKFDSVITLRAKLIEELKDHIPDSLTFKVGYFEGPKHSKMWIVTKDDITAMYSKFLSGEITLWCEGREEEVGRNKRKREEASSRYQEREEEVEKIYIELKQKHEDKYDTPKLRLWARMIASNLHDDLEDPPNIPAFQAPKKSKRESFSNVMSGAAVAFAKALSDKPSHANSISNSPDSEHNIIPRALSPAKSVELRMKNLEQLRYVQELFRDGILNEEEYGEQKQNILSAIKKL